jgi:integrase
MGHYAPKTVDHIHDVLSAILRPATKWGHISENPSRGVDLPTLRTVKPKWALTIEQSSALFQAMPPLPRTSVGLALLTGLRRGEVFSLRWKNVNLEQRHLTVEEAVYEGAFGTPKTSAGLRRVPLSDGAVTLLTEWKLRARQTTPDALLVSTWSGRPMRPENVLRRWVFPACDGFGMPRATWLTFRRTYASWAHEKGVPGRVVAQLMGHTNATCGSERGAFCVRP